MKFLYKDTSPEHVKFQRITMGWLAILSLFLRDIDLVWLFFGITLLGSIRGTEYSLVTLAYKLFKRLFKRDLVKISEHHIRYYQINPSMDFIDHLLRIIAVSCALTLFYADLEKFAWMLMSFLSIFMMLSAYFGFCLSALTYVALQKLCEKCNTSKQFWKTKWQCEVRPSDSSKHINENCVLAKRCFTPYKRCDTCHINIGQCLGSKFNSLMLIIGILMAAFLFETNPFFVQMNILVIMSLLFWLGYQVNYSMDDLTQSNNENILLNSKLKTYNESLEAEVKIRTAEIKRLATFDMLTGLLNRFSFEKILTEALANIDDKRTAHFAFIDLDKFKNVNDTGGHLAGDELLCKVSEMFMKTAGNNAVIGRLGGDEFGILFQDLSLKESTQLCQNICDNTNSLGFIWEGHAFNIGSSIGLATLEVSMQDIKALVYHADTACYKAKKSGRNQVCVHADDNIKG